ncbi:MAG: ABC transporter substrate-binding protein [Magnetospirillum sp.]
MSQLSKWVASAVSACAIVSAVPALAADKVVKIGAVQSMSGAYAAYAEEGQPVFDYLIQKINAEGGIKSMGGAKIELILADDSSQPARTAAEARRLITQENVSMLVGTILSGQMLALSPVLDELKVPALSWWAAGSKSPYIYSLGFPYDRGYAKTMADYADWLVKEKGYKLKTVAMVYSNYEAGQQVNKYLTERLKAKGFEIVGEVPLDVKAQDQTAAMVRLRSLKPDFTAGLLTPRDGQLLLRARHSLNYHDSLFLGGTAGFADMSLWRELGPDIAKATLTHNLYAMTGFATDAQMPALTAIIKEIKDKKLLKGDIGQAAIQAAQAAMVVQATLEAAGSTEPEKIAQAFSKVNIPAGDPRMFLLKADGLSFNDDRLLNDGGAVMIQWTEDRKQEVVFPKVFATTEPRPQGQ